MAKSTDEEKERAKRKGAALRRIEARRDDAIARRPWDFPEQQPRNFIFTRDKPSEPVTEALHLYQRPNDQDIQNDAPNRLFVYEPWDLNDLSLAEVKQVWEDRHALCGSLEAAAETLAILRADSGADDSYRGWQSYLNHPLVSPLAEDLPRLWAPKPSPPASPTETGTPAENATSELVDVDAYLVDKRQVAARNVKLRLGQTRFRDEVFAFHGERCCITGCAEDFLLEAAHIAPYVGAHSHDVRNGLCLRVDIHKLWDRHLIAIEPLELVVRVADRVRDAEYLALEGRRVFRCLNAPHRALLEHHYRAFANSAR